MKRITSLFLFCTLLVSCSDSTTESNPESSITQDTSSTTLISADSVYFSNDKAFLKFNVAGGALVDFQLKDKNVNPFTFELPDEWVPENNKSGAKFKGHFLCLGRWGAPTDGEIKAGIPHNGEPSRDNWIVSSNGENTKDYIKKTMSAKAPLDGLEVERDIYFDQTQPVAFIQEKITNTNTFGRISNVVQHATLGPPFLDKQLEIYSNAKKGFNQEDYYATLMENSFDWPEGRNAEDMVDMNSSVYAKNYCMSYIYDTNDVYGYVVAISQKYNLLVGYVWNIKEYPWINIWHAVNEEGTPFARGIEFGTAGMGRDYKELLDSTSTFYGYNSYEWIDAGETKEKGYILFQESINDWKGIKDVTFKNGILTINSRNNKKIEMKAEYAFK